MSNSDEKLALQETLLWQLNFLQETLAREDIRKSYHYLMIAGILRVQLCDADTPILLRFAELSNATLHVFGPPKLSQALKRGMVLRLNRTIASWIPFAPRCDRYTITEYLDAEIGIQPIGNGQSKEFTPRQLVKWVCNKDGVSHLDLSKPATLRSLKSWKSVDKDGEEVNDALVRDAILQIGQWAVYAIQEALATTQSFSIAVSLKLLRLPDYDFDFFALSTERSAASVFCRVNDQVLFFDIQHVSGIAARFVIEVPEHWRPERFVAFAFCYDADKEQITLWIDDFQQKMDEKFGIRGFGTPDATMVLLQPIDEYFTNANCICFNRTLNKEDLSTILKYGEQFEDDLPEELRKPIIIAAGTPDPESTTINWFVPFMRFWRRIKMSSRNRNS